MNWLLIISFIVQFCGNVFPESTISANQCRHERIECIKRMGDASTQDDDAVTMIDKCLSNPDTQPIKKPAIKPSPSPSPSLSRAPVSSK